MAEAPVGSQAGDNGSAAQAHAAARRRVISTLAVGATNWIIALVAVTAILVVSFVSSAAVYFRQQHQIAAARATIADASSTIANLQDQLARWQDPAYVEAQARDRLGWVMPGEVGYRVIDANGVVIGGLTDTIAAQDSGVAKPWYDLLGASVTTADKPAPVQTQTTPSAPATVGPDSTTTPR